jgi:hypothetical protein
MRVWWDNNCKLVGVIAAAVVTCVTTILVGCGVWTVGEGGTYGGALLGLVAAIAGSAALTERAAENK